MRYGERFLTSVLAVVAMSGLALACSDDSDEGDTNEALGSDATCGESACGGDLVGTWEVDELCGWPDFEQAFGDAECEGSSVRLIDVALDGSVNYRAAGTYTASLRLTGSFELSYPRSCLGGGTCADLDAALQQSLAESPIRAASCSGGQTCKCVAELRPDTIEEQGEYETKGNVVTMTSDDGTVSKVDYCASGKTLYLAEDNRGESPELVLKKK